LYSIKYKIAIPTYIKFRSLTALKREHEIKINESRKINQVNKKKYNMIERKTFQESRIVRKVNRTNVFTQVFVFYICYLVY
jgi:rRNA-processing protein FCF1